MDKRKVIDSIIENDNYGLLYIPPFRLINPSGDTCANTTGRKNKSFKKFKDSSEVKKSKATLLKKIDTRKEEIGCLLEEYQQLTNLNPNDFRFKWRFALRLLSYSKFKEHDRSIYQFNQVFDEISGFYKRELSKCTYDIKFQVFYLEELAFVNWSCRLDKDLEAIKLLNKALKLKKKASIYHRLALLYNKNGDYYSALNSWDQYILLSKSTEDDEMADLIKYRAHLKREINDETFIVDYLKAIELNPEYNYWLLTVADYYLRNKKDVKKAVEILYDYLEFNDFRSFKRNMPNDINISLWNILFYLIKLKKFDETEKLIDLIIEKSVLIFDHKSPTSNTLYTFKIIIQKRKKYLKDNYQSWITESEDYYRLRHRSHDFFMRNSKGIDFKSKIARSMVKITDNEIKLIYRFLDNFGYNLSLASDFFGRGEYDILKLISEKREFE